MKKLLPLLLLLSILSVNCLAQVKTTTGPHQAILNYSNASCTSNAQCSLQVYRATCTSATTCPTFSTAAPSGTWKTLDMTVGLTPQIGANGSTWVYNDQEFAL